MGFLFGKKQNKTTKKSTKGKTITIGKNLKTDSTKNAKESGIKGAQWFADRKQFNECELCKVLDGKTISVNHPDFNRFIPPLHEGCKCIRMYIGKNNTGEIYDWETPDENLVRQYVQHKK